MLSRNDSFIRSNIEINAIWLKIITKLLFLGGVWPINPCRLFNAKSIFIQIISSISNSSALRRYSKNVKTLLFQVISFSISTQFSSIWPIEPYHSEPEWTWEWWQWRFTQHSPKRQHYWNLAIRLFSAISMTLVVGVLPLCRAAVGVFTQAEWAPKFKITGYIQIHPARNWDIRLISLQNTV